MKIEGTFDGLKSKKNSLESLGTLDFHEIWPASSCLHLIGRKNPFLSKEDQKFEFHSKWEFRLIFYDSLNPKLYF
jgi:hypothetical protein